jgi:hypothetical protein
MCYNQNIEGIALELHAILSWQWCCFVVTDRLPLSLFAGGAGLTALGCIHPTSNSNIGELSLTCSIHSGI